MLMVSKLPSLFYNWKEKVLRDGVVDYHLVEATKKYSSVLVKKVKELLNEGRRNEEETMGESCKGEVGMGTGGVEEYFVDIGEKLRSFEEGK